jgi:hypothetical protein
LAAQKGQHHSKKPISKEWLVEHYNNRGLSMQACADLQQCSPTTIMKAINKYALPKRKCTERAHAVVRTRIQNDDWPLLLIDRTGNNNPAKRMDVREKIRQSKLGEKNWMFNRTGPAHHMYGMRGKKNPRYGIPCTEDLKRKLSLINSKPKIERCCDWCGELFKMTPSEHNNGRRYCSVGCRAKSMSGKNSPQWRGGTSFHGYCPKFNTRLKEEIRELFGRKCYLCAKSEKENRAKLDVHHCDYNKGQGCGQKWSLIPLCRSCHAKTGIHRHHYFALLSTYWATNPDINFNFSEITT